MPNDELIERNYRAAVDACDRITDHDIDRASAARSSPTYEQGIAAGLEMAAAHVEQRSGLIPDRQEIASAIRALADQHKPSPAEEPMP